MRKNNTEKLRDIIQESLKSLNVEGKIKEVSLIKSWEEMVGKTISKSTVKIYIKNRKLFVHLRSSVIRNELFMMREQLCESLNKRVGEKLIDEIIFN